MGLKPIQLNDEIVLLAHSLSYDIKFDSVFYENVLVPGENYTVLEFDLIFNRKIAHHIIVVFVPLVLITTTCFTPFWLHSAVERVTMSITGLLAVVTQSNQIRTEYPSLSYITEIDIFILFCLFIAYAALVHCVAVEYIKSKLGANQDNFIEVTIRYEVLRLAGQLTLRDKIKWYLAHVTPDSHNRIARIAFPTVLLTFCVTYFIVNAINASIK